MIFSQIKQIMLTVVLIYLLDTLPRRELRDCIIEAQYARQVNHKGFCFEAAQGRFKDEIKITYLQLDWQIKEAEVWQILETKPKRIGGQK
jgi:hypothetical protein